MTGGRLTLEERRSIAQGIADGLGYAEIGRRLGRPTSTISREVARNGNGRYSADAAHEAARHHVRTLIADAPSGRPDEASEFVDEFAALLAATGMPRMASRVFTALLVSPAGDLTAADLVQRLRVSPAAVSKSVGYLDDLGLLRREADHGTRRERYVIDDDVWLRALSTDSSAHAEVAAGASRGVAIFGPETAAGRRLGLMGRFFGELTEQISGIDLADPVVGDAMTVLAALVHAERPLAVREIAAALDWTRTRTTAALAELDARPALADPFAVHAAGGKHDARPRPDRLAPEQATALRRIS